MTERTDQAPVVVSLASLSANSLPLDTLTEAFGPSSLGIILVKDLPAQFLALRLKLLQYASYLAHLPSAELQRVTVPEAKYLTGWSHGVETLKSGKKDSLKGSWYSNCTFYHEHHSAVRLGSKNASIESKIAELACAEEQLEHDSRTNGTNGVKRHADGSPDYRDFPEYTSPNVWPSEDLLPGFRKTLESLCCLVIDVAVLVARQCDRFAAESGIEGYESGYLERVVSTSKTTKARLLHYFPPANRTGNEAAVNGDAANADTQEDDDDDDDWCTTHKDHGCLTGLTSALFIDESNPAPLLDEKAISSGSDFDLPELKALNGSPDPEAGLYIRSRTGALTKVSIPADCLAFQTGEALERVTKGKFAAVPHYVRGPRLGKAEGVEKVARNTLAVFTQPNLSDRVDDKGTTFAEFAREIVGRNTVG